MTMTMLENPEDEELLIAFQDAKKKMQYKEARKMLAKSRTTREFYPMKGNGKGKSDRQKVPFFDGDCMRCGKHGHKARNCPQKTEKAGASQKPSAVNYVIPCEKSESPVYVSLPAENEYEPIYADLPTDKQFHGVVDSGASETIIGVDTLQDLFERYEVLGFDPREEIKVDRTLKKTFIFGNSAVSEAIGLAQLTVGLFGKEYVIEAHVVDGSAPLLLSSKFLYQFEMMVDFKTGCAYMPGDPEREIQLERAPSYHLLMPILDFCHGKQTTSGSSRTESQHACDPNEGQPEH